MEALHLYFSLISIIITLYFIKWKLQDQYRNLPPSPSASLPIIGHLHLLKRPLHRALAGLSARHGPILSLRFGSRPVILVSSPDLAEECFTKNDVVFANRPRLLAGKHLGYDYTTLVWSSYGSHWRNLRRIASTQILSTHRLQMFSHIRADEVRLLMRRLFRAADGGGGEAVEFNKQEMKTLFFELTLNIVMRMIAGKRYYGESVQEAEEARKFKEIVGKTFQLSVATNLVDFIPALRWVGLTGGIEGSMIEVHKERDAFMKSLVEEHRKRMDRDDCSSSASPAGGSKTLIDVLLSLQEEEPEYYRDEIIIGMIQVMLSAGSDTSAATTEWALSLLLNNPEVLRRAQAEIDGAVGSDRLIDESDLASLPYLHGIVMETLRICPVAPLIPPHESSEQCALGGYSIPRGSMLLVNAWAIQNDPKQWPEPERFRPERWLPEGDSSPKEGGLGLRMLPFGAGRRGCPGEGLAMRVVGLGVGSLLQCFDWKRVGEELVDMSEGAGLTMPKAEPLVALYRPRSAMVQLLSHL
ncbi:hypothetical protein SAY86_011980 [Trapa natans]|uniref:Isoflavone 2'-hydroxylase n=1 Tax=Trapa natans TaxID=22666 RepID=A0AAN7MC10_TRANT|nr:hypothetical protein SAY86_011980 [Trapa natans]